jgi:Glycosyltransferase family 87
MTYEAASRDAVHSVIWRVTTYGQDRDGRRLVAIIVSAYFALVGLPPLAGLPSVWPSMGVPAAPALFFDTRVLTAAIECRRLGLDPLINNPCDPAGRPLNYPRAWLLLRWIGLTQAHTELLALIFIVLFLAAFFLLVGRISRGEGILVAIALCSPSVMLGIERGNTDIVVFSLVAFAMVLWRNRVKRFEILSPLAVFAAAILKLFPVLGLPAFLFVRRRTAAIAALAVGVAFVVYAFVFKDDLAAIMRGTPQGTENAYGARILPAAIYHRFVADRWRDTGVIKQMVALVPLLLGLPVIWVFGRRRRRTRDQGASSWRRLAFLAGSFVFLGTFMIGNNWDYRLVFLLLTLPQLFAWIVDPAADPRATLATYTLVSILVDLWIGALARPLALADELATWALVGLLVALLAASLPSFRFVGPRVRNSWIAIRMSGPRP